MRIQMTQALRGVAACLLLLSLTATPAAAGKKPKPPQIEPDPQVTYLLNGRVWVANADGSNNVDIYRIKHSYPRHPRMAPDRRSVVFVEIPLGGTPWIRRTTFRVDSSTIVATGTETLFEVDLAEPDVVLSPERSNGTKMAFILGDNQAGGVGIYELDIEQCAVLPCVESDLRLLWQSEGSIRMPLGGYSANGQAFYFQETPDIHLGPWFIKRLDLSDLSRGAEAISGPQGYSATLDAGNVDYGGLESRILFDKFDPDRWETELFILDTWSGIETPLGDGHAAAWLADDSAILFLELTYENWLTGPAWKMDLATPGPLTLFVDFACDPDWR